MKERQPKSGFSFVKWVIILVLILAICLVTFFCIKSLPIFGQEKASLSSSNIVTALQTSSELITSKVNFRGIAKYSDEGVPVINKGDFVMVYTATVKAGIDIDKVKSAVDNQNQIVYIYLPDAEVLDVKVNNDSVEFYNKSFVLFNSDEKSDTADALHLAEEDAKSDALETGILELANQHSKTLIKGILEGVVDGYSMEFFDSLDLFQKKASQIESASSDSAN